MPFPRLTTRRWMIAVGGVAMGMIIGTWPTRSMHYRRLARDHAMAAQAAREELTLYDLRLPLDRLRFGAFADADLGFKDYVAHGSRINALIEYHERMKRKYERAAWRPWLLVPPDPPEPQ